MSWIGEKIYAQVRELQKRAGAAEAKAEHLERQLQACLQAAGRLPDKPVVEGDYSWSPAYEAILILQRRKQ
jgi:hypothetical protein